MKLSGLVALLLLGSLTRAQVLGGMPPAVSATAAITPASVTASGPVSGTSLQVNGVLVMSTAPVSVANASDLLATLASGSTFFSFTPINSVTLVRVEHTIVVAGATGTAGDNVYCDAGGVPVLHSHTATAAVLGTLGQSAEAPVAVAAGTKVSCYLNTDSITKPILNMALSFVPQ